MEKVIKVCGDPHCEAVYHNTPKSATKCKDCGGNLITINEDTFNKKYADNYFQYDYETMDYYRPEKKEKMEDKTDTTYKKIGDNPSKFDIGDIIVDALGREWKVIDPDKRGMSILKNLKTNSIQELNAHNNPQFKLVGKPSDFSGHIRPTEDNPVYDDLRNLQYQIMWWQGAKDNKKPTEKYEKAILDLKNKITKFDETTQNEKWKQQIRVVFNSSNRDYNQVIERIEKKYKTKSVKTTAKTKETIIDVAPEIEKEINQLSETLNKSWQKDYPYSTRYIEIRKQIFPDHKVKAKFFGKPLSAFKKNDIVGTLARNTDDDRYKITNITDSEVTLLPYNFMYPKEKKGKIADYGNDWELISPKQSLFKAYEKYLGSKPDKVAPKKIDTVVPPPSMKYVESPASKDIDILNKLVAEYIYAKDSATKFFKESLIKEHITDLKKYLNKPEIVENKKWKNSIDTSISSAMAVLNSNVLGRKKETMYKQTIPTKPEKLNFDYLFSSNSGDRKSPTQSAGQLRSMYSGKPKYEKELFNTLFQGNDKNWYKLIKDKDGVWRWSKAEEQSEMKKPEPKPETKSSTTNKIDINNKMYLIQINGKPLSSFKNGDKVFFAGKTQEGNFKTYVEGSVLKKGNEYYIKRFPENPVAKRYATAYLSASTKVALKPENEPIYIGDENFKTEKKEKASVKIEPKKEKPITPQIDRNTQSEDDLIKYYYEKLNSQPITPRIFAKQLIAVDVLRNASIRQIKEGMHGRVNDIGWVSVGGYVDGKNVTTNKVLVQKFKGKEINELFSLQELYNEIQREAGLMPDKETKPKKEKPKNTTKDLKDALAGAKAYLKYAKDSEKSDIKAYIRGLEILLK